MNRRDIFIMMYYCLDAYWDNHQTEELGNICSDMNPFLFEDGESANPAVWDEFCNKFEDKDYSMEESLKIVKEFVKTLESAEANKAINEILLDEWKEACEEYLKSSNDNS